MATTAAAQTRDKVAEASVRWGSWLMGIAAVGFIGYKDAIQQFSPGLYHYISHLHIAVAGFIAATGLAVLFLVAYGVRRGELWAWVGAVAAPVLGLAVALPAHYPNHFDTLGHLGLIYVATLIFVTGALLALRGIIAQHRG
jgi:cytochrome bd-type quinol oxidase subunit 2